MIEANQLPHVSRIDQPAGTPGTRGYYASGDYTDRKPLDRVRWGPIVGGLFAALGTLALLTVLGLAIGLSNVDAQDRPGDFGLGSGIWAAISALIAFFVGGWVAGASSARRSGGAGALQGTLVWCATIGLLIYMIAGGVNALFRTAGDAATATASVINRTADTSGANANNPANTSVPPANDPAAPAGTTRDPADAIARQAESVRQQVTPENVERAAESAARGAWGTLISMLLGLGAAALGGFLGGKNPDEDYIDDGDREGVARTRTTVAPTPAPNVNVGNR